MLLYQSPLPDSTTVEKFYSAYKATKTEEGHGYLDDATIAQYQNEKKLSFNDLGFDLSILKGKRVLDVGCANGAFLELAKNHGAEAFGIDVSAELIAEAKRRGHNCSVATIDKVQGKFDVICLWDVLEHIYNPRDFLQQVSDKMNQGGILFIQTPRYGRIAQLFGAEWRYLLPVEHVVLYSVEALLKILPEFGFNVRQWVSFGSGCTTGSIGSIYKKVFDRIAKETKNGDTLVFYAVKEC
jgi:2-polyprenyl-3-methyl-5-hydroxy-6-metoxy-1,4-benzoquinol methylase